MLYPLVIYKLWSAETKKHPPNPWLLTTMPGECCKKWRSNPHTHRRTDSCISSRYSIYLIIYLIIKEVNQLNAYLPPIICITTSVMPSGGSVCSDRFLAERRCTTRNKCTVTVSQGGVSLANTACHFAFVLIIAVRWNKVWKFRPWRLLETNFYRHKHRKS